MTRDDIVEAARSCIGTPFVHQGRVRGAGMDCIGLVRYPAVSNGISIADRDGYGRDPFAGQLEAELVQHLEPVAITEIQPGDVLVFAIIGGAPQHLAIYTGTSIIHAINNGPCKVVEHNYAAPWPRMLKAAFRYPEVEA